MKPTRLFFTTLSLTALTGFGIDKSHRNKYPIYVGSCN